MSLARYSRARSGDTDEQRKLRRKQLGAARTVLGVGHDVASGSAQKAIERLMLSGIKLAEAAQPDKTLAKDVFTDPLVNPIVVLRKLEHSLGKTFVALEPESLFSQIDRLLGRSAQERANALEHFHDTGEIDSQVPELVRQKIYSLRTILTSDSAHNEWFTFEKIGGVFNDRTPQWGTLEPLTPGECARTVAIIEAVRPDKYAEEVLSYIAACAHEDGLLTLKPSKYLHMADALLQKMNSSQLGESLPDEIVHQIEGRMHEIAHAGARGVHINMETADTLTIQAVKLLGADAMGEEALQAQGS